jgi:hypothetical protein
MGCSVASTYLHFSSIVHQQEQSRTLPPPFPPFPPFPLPKLIGTAASPPPVEDEVANEVQKLHHTHSEGGNVRQRWHPIGPKLHLAPVGACGRIDNIKTQAKHTVSMGMGAKRLQMMMSACLHGQATPALVWPTFLACLSLQTSKALWQSEIN